MLHSFSICVKDNENETLPGLKWKTLNDLGEEWFKWISVLDAQIKKMWLTHCCIVIFAYVCETLLAVSWLIVKVSVALLKRTWNSSSGRMKSWLEVWPEWRLVAVVRRRRSLCMKIWNVLDIFKKILLSLWSFSWTNG